MEILIPNTFRATKTPFSDMVLSRGQLARAAVLFEKTLRESFDDDERLVGKDFRRRIQTDTEMKRRAQIMARWFRVFRGDLGFSLPKIEVELGRALRSELDGGLYTPTPAQRSYAAPEGDYQ